ncbi:MAG TPA: ATPase, T2SS/T4P/T4SS family [Vicinamibacterales bacterium]
MSLVPSLLRAIVTIDGDALVLHVGDKPYVLSASGQIDLAPRGLTYDSVAGVIAQLLPEDAQKALQEYGAAQHELTDLVDFPGEQFNVVAARGGDDVWVEIRRRRQPGAAQEPGEGSEESSGDIATADGSIRVTSTPPPVEFPGVSGLWPDPAQVAETVAEEQSPRNIADERGRRSRVIEPGRLQERAEERAVEAPQPAVVLPLTKNPLRSDPPPPLAGQALSGLDRLLRLAAARGASTLYLSSGTRPSIRVDGEVQALESTPVLGPNDVESLLLTLMPERNAEALRTGSTSEWICDFEDLGRVRCMSFRDHRGPGGVFRIMPTRAVTSQQLGLSREIQELAAESEGLVLVAGPRSSGKRTLMSALVDLINRTRHAHVITIEREINVVHERGLSFVSQREAHGGADEMLDVARAALREDPDVLVLESVRSAELMNLALDAAASGRLVICGFPAHNTTGAVDGIIDLFPPDARRQVQIALAQNLRGVIVQVLLNKTGGGRLAARELLLNTPAVASVISEGKTSQLPLVIEGGRKHGMVPLNDALAGFVQSGAVELREAFQRSQDRTGFLAILQRQGIDTSSVERFA